MCEYCCTLNASAYAIIQNATIWVVKGCTLVPPYNISCPGNHLCAIHSFTLWDSTIAISVHPTMLCRISILLVSSLTQYYLIGSRRKAFSWISPSGRNQTPPPIPQNSDRPDLICFFQSLFCRAMKICFFSYELGQDGNCACPSGSENVTECCSQSWLCACVQMWF